MATWIRRILVAIRTLEHAPKNELYKAGALARALKQQNALNALLDAGRGRCVGGMTNKKYAQLNRVSPATAQ